MKETEKYVNWLQTFTKQVDRSVEEMLDKLNQGKECGSQYDIKLDVKGNVLAVPMNADSYSRLTTFLLGELEEANDASHYDRIEPLAKFQEAAYCENGGQYEDWFITFDSFMTQIVNPFNSMCMRFGADPVKEYGKAFLLSDWLVESKVRELELQVGVRKYIGQEVQTGYGPSVVKQVFLGDDGKWMILLAKFGHEFYTVSLNSWNDLVMK